MKECTKTANIGRRGHESKSDGNRGLEIRVKLMCIAIALTFSCELRVMMSWRFGRFAPL